MIRLGLIKIDNHYLMLQKVHNQLTSSAKRRLRRQKLRAEIEKIKQKAAKYKRKKASKERKLLHKKSLAKSEETGNVEEIVLNREIKQENKTNMSSTDNKSREDVMAARQAKKLAKQKGKTKDIAPEQVQKPAADVKPIETPVKQEEKPTKADPKVNSPKSKDEVDKACLREEQEIVADKSKDDIKAERAAKKAAKQAKKKGASDGGDAPQAKPQKETAPPANENMTVKDVVETLRDIANVAKEIQGVTDKVIDLGAKKVRIYWMRYSKLLQEILHCFPFYIRFFSVISLQTIQKYTVCITSIQ